MRTGHPVRSAILKHQIGRLVVEWVTISKYLLLYVFCIAFLHCQIVVEFVEVVEFYRCHREIFVQRWARNLAGRGWSIGILAKMRGRIR